MKKQRLILALITTIALMFSQRAKAESQIDSTAFTALANDSLPQFWTNFEGGSMGSVTLIDSLSTKIQTTDSTYRQHYHYSVKTKVDPVHHKDPSIYSHMSNRWFYFMVSNVAGKTLSLDIDFNDSARPMYSYDNINFQRCDSLEAPLLHSTITIEAQRDSIYIAYFTPYTNSRNQQKIEQWSSHADVEHLSLGKSTQGREIDALVISSRASQEMVPNAQGDIVLSPEQRSKQIIYVHSRIHPSESPASWFTEALVDTLLGESPLAQALRDKAIFYVVPFTNPDGVFEGLSRVNTNGVNLEVSYDQSPEDTTPEVEAIKALFEGFERAELTPALALNMHSQSTPMVTYWTHSAASTDPLYSKKMLMLSVLSTQDNEYFDPSDISYSNVQGYYLEGVLYEKFKGQTLAITFETPYSYYGQNPDGAWVTLENLSAQSTNILSAISDLLGVGRDIIVDEKDRGSIFRINFKRCQHDDKAPQQWLYFGDSFLESRRSGANLTYRTELEKGTYRVYMWQVGELPSKGNDSLSSTENTWVEIGNHTQQSSGKIKYKIKSEYKGQKFDRIKFVPITQEE